MAEASFILRAVDATKQAFASVQNSLAKLQQSSQTAAGFMKKAFDPRALGAGFAAALGLSLTSVIDSVITKLTELVMRAENVRKILRESRLESEGILEAGIFAAMDPVRQLETIQAKIIKNAAEIDKLRSNVREEVVALPQGGSVTVQLGSVKEAEDLKKLEAMRASLVIANLNLINQIERDTAEIKTKSDDESLDAQKKVNDLLRESSNLMLKGLEVPRDDASARIEATIAQTLANRELGKSLSDSVMTPMEKYVAALERIDLLHAKKTIDDETMIRLTGEAGAAFAATSGDVEDMASRLGMVNETANKTIPAMSQLAQMSNDAGSLIAQGFEDAILSGQKLSEVVRALGRDLVRLVFQQMVTQRLAAGVTGVLQGKGFAGFMAAGGPVSAGSSYVVGEKGPELFVPHASGTIVPNNKMGGGSGSGSGSVTVNYNIAAGVSRAELAPILEQERRRLKAEIPDMVRRGGGYRAAFA
jgi:hypothetical protein